MDERPRGRSLRIAMLAVHSSPVGDLGTQDTGGMSVYVREVARELGRMGHEVDIFTRQSEPEDAALQYLCDHVRLLRVRAGTHGPVQKLALYPHLEEFCEEILRFRVSQGRPYDLLQSHYWLSGLVGIRLKRCWQIPHFVVFHTLGALKNRTDEPQKEPAIRLRAEKRLAATADRILASTQAEKTFLTRHLGANPGRIAVVPCGVDLELFQPVDKAEARRRLGFHLNETIILFVGRFAPLKGIDRLVESLAYLQSLHRTRLVVVGGDGSGVLDARTPKSPALGGARQGAILFPGRIEQARLPLYYSAADLLVMPSQYESFGLVALEALACGTPVVATPVGAMPDLIRHGENGCLVQDGSPECLARGIETVLAWCRGRSPQAIRASALSFGWRRTALGLLRETDALHRPPDGLRGALRTSRKPLRRPPSHDRLALRPLPSAAVWKRPVAGQSPAKGVL